MSESIIVSYDVYQKLAELKLQLMKEGKKKVTFNDCISYLMRNKQ